MSDLDDSLEAEPGARPTSRRPLLAPLGLVLGLVLATGLLGWQLQTKHRLAEAAPEAELAGRAVVSHMMTYDHATLDEDFAWVARDGTRLFAQTFQGTVDDVRELAIATSAHSEVEIRGSGVHLEDDHHATVLVAADQTITEPARAGDQLQRWRISLTLVKENGRWLVDAIELL